ncbi:ATP-binding protein [Aquitalea aquatilis]|uniref:ATP-binding protein n=1 Tax=Aquitalea aquatilis TaxID=1537400 RepID=UPI0010BE17C8|nr:ATP-binding protein [Aquitalea aquatilis]
MKLQSIKISNFQSLRNADMQLHAPVALVSGKNGAGKSSLRDAVVMALSGEPTRVSKKKDYLQMVAEGQKAASISVELADGRRTETTLPDGETKFFGKQIEDPEKARAALQYVLSPERFAAAAADDRRSVLFTLTGCRASAEEVQKRLAARGADPVKVDAVLPLLRAGFPSAEKDAKTRATEAKGAWRAVTGETYGEKKAEGWKADKPVVAEEAILQAEHDLDVVNGEIAQAQQNLGTLKAQHQASGGRAAKIAQLTEQAGKLASIEKRLVVDEQDLANVKDQVAAISAGPAPRTGLVHDLARALNGMVNEKQPLGSDRPVYVNACNALDLYEDAHGSLNEEGKPASPEDLAHLPELQRSLGMMERAVANDHRDLKQAQDAAAQLKVLQEEEGGETVTDAQVAAAAERINTLQASQKKLAADLEGHRASQRAAAEAAKKTKEAGKHHADVLAWSLIADALAPDGIPGEILADALRPVNDLLFEYAKLAGWARVQISHDMDITADGRVYGLLSESEQWRTDCLLALVVANLSGLRLVVLDRFDVLDMAGRKDMLGLLDELAYGGDLDSAVVCGTLKEVPTKLPDTMQSFWIENGEVVAVARAEERKAA